MSAAPARTQPPGPAPEPGSREALILSCYWLARAVASRHRAPPRTGLEPDDLFQAALVGLCRAADRYDPSLGVRFSTFAGRWMEGCVRREIEDHLGGLIRVPRSNDRASRRDAVGRVSCESLHSPRTRDGLLAHQVPAPPPAPPPPRIPPAVRRELASLPPAEAALLHAHLLGGSVSAAGRALGLYRQMAHLRLSRALARLRAAWGPDPRALR